MAISCMLCGKNMSRYEEYGCCRNKCNKNFHISCVSIPVEKFVSMKSDGTIKDWMCPSCNAEVTSNLDKEAATPAVSPPSDLELFLSAKIDEAVRSATSTLITKIQLEFDKLMNENKRLSKQITELRATVKLQKSYNESSEIPTEGSIRPVNKSNINNINKDRVDNKNTLTHKNILVFADKPLNYSEKVSRSLKENIDKSIADKETAEIQNNVYKTLSPENYYPDRENTGTKKKKVTADGKIVSDFSKTTIDDFTLVVNRKRNKTRSDTVIKGSATNSILKGVEKQAHLHVYRLDKSTNVEDIVTHLKSNQFNKISCEKLQSKHPEEYTFI